MGEFSWGESSRAPGSHLLNKHHQSSTVRDYNLNISQRYTVKEEEKVVMMMMRKICLSMYCFSPRVWWTVLPGEEECPHLPLQHITTSWELTAETAPERGSGTSSYLVSNISFMIFRPKHLHYCVKAIRLDYLITHLHWTLSAVTLKAIRG